MKPWLKLKVGKERKGGSRYWDGLGESGGEVLRGMGRRW